MLLTKLRNRGSFIHNSEVLQTGKGELSVVYRPSHHLEADENDYVPCCHCLGSYRRYRLWRHVRSCTVARFQSSCSEGNLLRPVTAGELLLPSVLPPMFRRIVQGMKKDEKTIIIRNDSLLQKLASKLMQRVAHSKHHDNYIRNRLRQLVELLLKVRSSKLELKNADMHALIRPCHFKLVLELVKSISGYNDNDHSFTVPSKAIRLGHDVKKCAMLVRCAALQEEDRTAAKNAQAFVELCSGEWLDEISCGARRTLQARKVNKPLLLPLAADVCKLHNHLRDIHQSSRDIIAIGPTDLHFAEAFRRLQESFLGQLILFNRRRQGEVSMLLMSHVKQANNECVGDVYDTLSSLEKELLHNFVRIEIPGKRNNIVPLLLIADQKHSMDILMNAEMRQQAGISSDNQYIFAASRGSVGYLRGILRSSSEECGAQNAEQLHSTLLRKHIATLSQVLNLREHELDQLVRYMGHDIKIHR
jgi:hypothetical protein